MPRKRHSHRRECSPFRVMADGCDYRRRNLFLREDFQHLRFAEAWIIERGPGNFAVAFDEQRTHGASGRLACERNFLTKSELRQPGNQCLLGDVL